MRADDDLLEAHLPQYDVSDAVACTVSADVATTWRALLDADLLDVGRKRPAVAALGFIRLLPELASHLLHGELERGAPERLSLKDMTALPVEQGGWTLLGERPEDELALGLVGKFWRPVIDFTRVERDDFASFDEPGWAKTVYDLRVRPLADDRTLLSATMRTQATDDHARRWFRRYWTFGIGSGAHVLVNGLIEIVRDAAEAEGAQEFAA